METRFCQGITKAFDFDKAEIYAWASKAVIDRTNELITGEAWMHADSTRGFEQSGSPLLIAHNYQTYPPLGRVTKLEKSHEGLKFRAKIAKTDVGRQVARYISDCGSAAFSVGFEGIAAEDWQTEKMAKAGFDTSEVTTDKVRVWTHCRLLEISMVSVPALSSATIIGEKYAKGEIVEKSLLSALNGWKNGHGQKSDQQEIAEEVKRILAPRIGDMIAKEIQQRRAIIDTATREAQIQILRRLGRVASEDQLDEVIEELWPTGKKKPGIVDRETMAAIVQRLTETINLKKRGRNHDI